MADELKGLYSVNYLMMRVEDPSKRLPHREGRPAKKFIKKKEKKSKESLSLPKGKIINICV
ncbi:hypothetical protein [Thermodesulfatator autotrophicus]|uniref:Uncharacterized protein n=1 Tax=Thermodesulfatator autotrophicus TaxID=1795632 RepID=A0A177EA76_9BACT|nr:hypothetical protein [Thermodesulfatator autotrophicus]OAG28646.1 hypothetical protein TH606_00670 [Thermodesulfatator autotrophicus]